MHIRKGRRTQKRGQQMSPQKTAVCPQCNTPGAEVKPRTIKHWLLTDLVPSLPAIPFYFCKTKNCPVVYFSEDGSIQHTKEKVRYPIGIKNGSRHSTICYCFGVTEEMILKEIQETGKSSFSTWIAKEIKEGNCACDVCNPKGSCCLAEIKNTEKEH